MDKITLKVKMVTDIELKIGDSVVAASGEWHDLIGEVTHIFDEGRRCTLNNTENIYTRNIKVINGVEIRGGILNV